MTNVKMSEGTNIIGPKLHRDNPWTRDTVDYL